MSDQSEIPKLKKPTAAEKQAEIIRDAIVSATDVIGKKSNRVGWWTVGINAGLLIITIGLFWYNKKGIDSSAKSSLSSDSTSKATLEATKKYNDSFIVIQKATFDSIRYFNNQTLNKQQAALDSSSVSNALNFQRTSKSLSLQDSSLKETQREFEIETRPFIQVVNIKFDTLEANKQPVISYIFTNFGKQPVKLIKNRVSVTLSKDPNYSDFSSPDWSSQICNVYVTGQAIYDDKWRSRDKFDAGVINQIKNGVVTVFFIGELTLQNTVNSKKSIYYYHYRIGYKPSGYFTEGLKDTTINIDQKLLR